MHEIPERYFQDLCIRLQEIITSRGDITKKDIHILKRKLARTYRLPRLPKDYEILDKLPPHLKQNLKDSLKSKPVRTISGVAVIAVMTKPLPCPGHCIYCPGGIKSEFQTPQSYTGHEPAARRAYELGYDPYKQVRYRINQLEAIGHNAEKIEIIIMGGTFLAAPPRYKEWFIRGIYEGLLGKKYPNKTLLELQEMLENAKYRLVGLTIETRPDFCTERYVDEMLFYGATRVEIGVQTLYDEILKFIKRGHTVEDTKKAFRIARDAGFKIVAHMMPNLPLSDPKTDVKMFIKLFSDPDLRPDMLKIYPTAVIKGTKLYDMWIHKEYEPYSEETLINILARIKKMIPPWVRIQRVQRDIPVYLVDAGYSIGNLRQVVQKYMERKGWRCRCIRCREAGLNLIKNGLLPDDNKIRLLSRRYTASGGEEIFLSFEDIKNDIIIGFLRLRKPSELAHRPEIDSNTMIVRELHVYGPLVPLGERRRLAWQHRGYGKRLLKEAEKIAREEFDARKIVVISGIGVRNYYKMLGYHKEGPYMSKKLV